MLTLKPRQVVDLLKRLQAFWHRFAPAFNGGSSGNGGWRIFRGVCRDTHVLDRVAGLGVWHFMEAPVDTRM
ncbi:MAG: hypothetical protein ACUVRJ_11040 [Candidatus Villigracilaceae bacterium]